MALNAENLQRTTSKYTTHFPLLGITIGCSSASLFQLIHKFSHETDMTRRIITSTVVNSHNQDLVFGSQSLQSNTM